MYAGTLAFLTGVLWLMHLPALPHRGWTVLLAALVPAALGPSRWRLPAAAGAGFLWAAFVAGRLLLPGLDPGLEGRDLAVAGCIVGLPRPGTYGTRFRFSVEHARAGVPARLRLSWYERGRRVRAGDCWRLTVRLKRPHGFMNPGGFDYEGWLFRHGIGATGYVRPRPAPVRIGPRWTIDGVRQRLAARIDVALGSDPFAGVVRALALGDRRAITPAQRDILNATGTAHLVAISGLHLGLVAGFAFLAVGTLWRLSGAARWWPAPRAGAVAALAAAGLYALLAGGSLPTRRALIMLAVGLSGILRGRVTRPLRALCAALLAVLVLEPTAVLAPAFWLSFGAVAVILYAAGGGHARRGWRAWTGIQWRVALGLLPVSLVWFQQAGATAPLMNLLAVPWIGLVAVPLILAGTTALAFGLPVGAEALRWGAEAVGLLWPLLRWGAGLPGALWVQAAPPAWTWAPALIGVALLLAPRGVPGRWLGGLYLAPMLVWSPSPPPAGALRLTLLDVGQGLAAVVRTRRHVLVYDTGPRFGPGFDAGQAVLVPYLRSRGIRRVDRLIVSHGDNDHIGGAASLLSRYPAAVVLSSVPQRVRAQARPCRRGQHWNWDGVEFRMLHPGAAGAFHGNDASCVLRVTGRGGAVLLTGDIEAPAERRLAADMGAALRARVLVVPHHGSRSSSTPAFVAAVHPRLALIPVGYRNRFRLPSACVRARYRAAGARVLDTAAEGAVRIELGPRPGAFEVHGHRREAGRFWNPRAVPARPRARFRPPPESSTLRRTLSENDLCVRAARPFSRRGDGRFR